jgi:hypothetical protein
MDGWMDGIWQNNSGQNNGEWGLWISGLRLTVILSLSKDLKFLAQTEILRQAQDDSREHWMTT